jgi:hypothetical protein
VKKKKRLGRFFCFGSLAVGKKEVADASGQSVILLHVSWPTVKFCCTPVFFGHFFPRWRFQTFRFCLSTHTAITWECSRLCCCVCTCKKKKKPHHTSKRAKRNKKLAGSVMADMAAKATVRHSCVYTPTFVRQWPHSRWPYPVFRWMRSSTHLRTCTFSDRRPFWWRVNQSWLTSWEWFVIFESFK